MAKKILVVDDDLDSLKLIGLVLQRRGYDIIAAQSGAQALEKIESAPPDLVLLDIMMPGLDGYEVSRQIRSVPATADLPIIMFTAKTAVQEKVAGFEAGADDYLTKPVHPEELVSRVAAVLQRAQRRCAEENVSMEARTIGFVGAKGGVGTTTLAVNIAVALLQGADQDRKVAVAEMGPGAAAATFQLGLSRRGRIKNLLSQPAEEIGVDMVMAQLDEHDTGLLLLSGQIEPTGIAAPISSDHADVIVKHLGTMADYLLLDMGRGLDEVNQRLLTHCHQVVVVVEPSRAAMELARPLLEGISRLLNIPDRRISLVMVKKSHSSNPYTKDMIERLLKRSFAGIIPPAPDLAVQSSEQGVPIVILQPESLAARQIGTIASGLLET